MWGKDVNDSCTSSEGTSSTSNPCAASSGVDGSEFGGVGYGFTQVCLLLLLLLLPLQPPPPLAFGSISIGQPVRPGDSGGEYMGVVDTTHAVLYFYALLLALVLAPCPSCRTS